MSISKVPGQQFSVNLVRKPCPGPEAIANPGGSNQRAAIWFENQVFYLCIGAFSILGISGRTEGPPGLHIVGGYRETQEVRGTPARVEN
jgi:hypothetical protein